MDHATRVANRNSERATHVVTVVNCIGLYIPCKYLTACSISGEEINGAFNIS